MDIHLRSLVPFPSFSTVFLDGAKGKQQVLKELGGRVKSSAHCTLISTHSQWARHRPINFLTVNFISLLIFSRIPFHHFDPMQRIRAYYVLYVLRTIIISFKNTCAIIWSPSMATLRGTDIFKRATLVGNNKFMRKITSKGLSHVSYRVRTQRAKQLSQSKSTSKMLWSIPKYVPTMRCCLSGPEASEGPTR